MLKHDGGEREIEGEGRHDGQVLAVVPVDVRVPARDRLSRERDHFATNIYRVHFAEEIRECAGDPSGAASDLEHTHLLRVLALADVDHVGEDLFADGLLAGPEELL